MFPESHHPPRGQETIKNNSSLEVVLRYKATLWKVKAAGDRMKEDDWFQRDMWLAKNGSLVLLEGGNNVLDKQLAEPKESVHRSIL